ncbi:AAA family ATPase [Catenovulum sp. SM1970]|uniref:AAA family ATPase n=1 Tax=Marinifaba aquimaris TaxID=2741323 RepID=UPI001573FCB0|nr:AAA family ATPase [Marinifaba aquimaris]NTS78225.1 AAA family ATPase [Marinifaba aquimaris]
MKNLIILRGLPGSGKTTFAELLGGKICSADHYFYVDGQYQFNPAKLKQAHHHCQRNCQHFMQSDEPLIIIANTSCTERELKPYYDLAKQYNYRVHCMVMENRHQGENTHQVPSDVLASMKKKLKRNILID